MVKHVNPFTGLEVPGVDYAYKSGVLRGHLLCLVAKATLQGPFFTDAQLDWLKEQVNDALAEADKEFKDE